MLLIRPDLLTDDDAAILGFAVDALSSGGSAALVTLVAIDGGSARALGSHMAVRNDGLYRGFVAGGCVEAAVAADALDAISAGVDRQVRYGRESPYFDIVLPCGGGITLAVHVLRSAAPLQAILASLSARQAASLRYDANRQTLEFIPHSVKTGWSGSWFDNGYRPRTRVVIYGRSIELASTSRLAQAAGYEVYAAEPSELAAHSPLVDQDTAVVLLYHDRDLEIPALCAALAARPFYIGALGSTRTHQMRIQTLTELGYDKQDIARIKAPIGIFAKARDANSLALSILADIAAARGIP